MTRLIVAGQPPTINEEAMPQEYNLVIYKGDFVDLIVNVGSVDSPKNIAGYVGKSSIKTDYSSTTSFDFTATIADSAVGTVKLYMPTSISKTIPVGSYVWDFELVDTNGDARTYLYGAVEVRPEVTSG